MEEERIREIIKEELLKHKLISDFIKNINGVDTILSEFMENIMKRLYKVETLIEANDYDYVTETKLVRKK